MFITSSHWKIYSKHRSNGYWTESIATGSNTFVKKILSELHSRIRGTKIVESGQAFQIREEIDQWHYASITHCMYCGHTKLGCGQKKRKIEYKGITIEFSKITPRLFNGFSFIDGYHMAKPEKAILDTIYYRGSIPAIDELELDDVNFDLLFQMQKSYPITVQKKARKLK